MEKKINWMTLLCISFLLITSCSHQPRAFSQAHIISALKWVMIKDCAYEGCSLRVDALKNQDIKIQIEAFNGILEPDVFTIKVIFFPSVSKAGFTFTPSSTFVELSNGDTVHAKGFYCPYTLHDLAFLRAAKPVVGRVSIPDDYKCFKLFFDVYPPSVEEEFSMELKGLYRNGEPVDVPTVYFRKAIRYEGYGKRIGE